MFQKMQAAGFELCSDKSQPEHPAAECVFFIIRFRPSGRRFLLHQCLMGNCQAKLDVCFHLPGMKRAVEKSEFHRSFGKRSM